MAQITEVSGGAARTNDLRIIPLVCSAHFVSHFYILVLPPLFPFIREFYGVSYTELGYALTAFNVTTALCQTPAGFLVDRVGPRLVLSTPILLNLLFFVMITFATTGVQNYSVVALGDAFGTPLGIASTALTVNLLLSAFGVLVGGWIATRVTRHEWVAAFSFAGIAVTAGVIGAADLGLVFLMIMMSLNGFTNGLMQPSRDMIVRAVTPE